MVVQVDKVKHCTGITPASWLNSDTYHVVPSVFEPDALSIKFGEVDRSSPEDTNPDIIARPKRNTGVPARLLCRVYAIPNFTSHNNVISKYL